MAWPWSKAWNYFGVWQPDPIRGWKFLGSEGAVKLTSNEAQETRLDLVEQYWDQNGQVFRYVWDEDAERWVGA